MTRIKQRLWAGVGVLALGLALAGCGGSPTEGEASGIVRDVDAAAGRVTIDHDDIPGLMKAMTMTFEVADPELLEGVDPGERVQFRIRYADGTYTVTSLDPS